jgi:glycosyltransferase involved in cell wall biosynthesis
LTLASKLGLRKKIGTQNWLDEEDLKNILNLSGFEVITTQKRFFAITIITIAKLKNQIPKINKQYSVSIIIPARNEEGNIDKIIPSIPKFGKKQEIIFIEGNSKDKTWIKVKNEERKRKNVKVFKQSGKGKADAVKLGLSKATGDILMIYDADRTVDAKDLKKFYNVLATGLGELANGSRLIYPMEKDAMQSLNKLGNQIFSWLFTWILGQHFKDTLCGTKAFFQKDYLKFKFSKSDPFGDFDLIFGAIRNNLRVIEIPVRYKERVYGSTNINRFHHGLLLAKMAWLAFWEFRT